jgi:hypothetical protein
MISQLDENFTTITGGYIEEEQPSPNAAEPKTEWSVQRDNIPHSKLPRTFFTELDIPPPAMHAVSKDGMTPLHLVSAFGNTDFMSALLQWKPNIEAECSR